MRSLHCCQPNNSHLNSETSSMVSLSVPLTLLSCHSVCSCLCSMQKAPKARPGIDGLLVSIITCTSTCCQTLCVQEHEFLRVYGERGEEVVSVWVRRVQEQMRILHSKKFPSDLSLTSTSSSWSGMSGHSAGHRPAPFLPPLGHTPYTSVPSHTSVGGGAFQYMEPT